MKLAVVVVAVLGCTGTPAAPPGDATAPRPPVDAAFDPWDPPAHVDPPADAAPASAAMAAPPVYPILSVPPPGPLVAGGHVESIRVLAAVEDGSAAVSADFDGNVRLWPSLDGAHEPVVVTMNAPVDLAMTRDGTELVLVGRDAAGGISLVRTTPAGEVRATARVLLERPATDVLATKVGIVALLDDHTLATLDLRGLRTGTLVPDAAHRIAALVGRRDRVLALVDGPDGLRGRWLTLGTAPAWGTSPTPVLRVQPATVALSPDGTRLAARTRDGRDLVIVALATGKIVARPYHAEHDEASLPRVFGFTDGATLALAVDMQLHWWHDELDDDTESGQFGEAFAVVDGRLLHGQDMALAVATRTQERYLGYRVPAASTTRAIGGRILVASGMNLVAVDAQLRARAPIAVPAIAGLTSLVEVVPIDASHAFAIGRDDAGPHVHVVDLADPTKSRRLLAGAHRVRYEPASRLYAAETQDAVYFGHVDAKTGAVEEPIRFYAHPELVMLLDPAVSGGITALVAERTDEALDVIEIRDVVADAADPFPRVRRKTVPLTDDELSLGFDPATVVLARGYRALAVHRSAGPDGYVATIDAARIALRDRAGTVRWTIANPGVTELAWIGGQLVGLGEGLARFDRDTGAVVDRQCGWTFGLWDDAPSGASAFLCDAEIADAAGS